MSAVRQLIGDHFGGANVHEHDTIADLGGDELTPIELLIEIDEQLDVDLPDDAITVDTTAGEIAAMVERARKDAA